MILRALIRIRILPYAESDLLEPKPVQKRCPGKAPERRTYGVKHIPLHDERPARRTGLVSRRGHQCLVHSHHDEQRPRPVPEHEKRSGNERDVSRFKPRQDPQQKTQERQRCLHRKPAPIGCFPFDDKGTIIQSEPRRLLRNVDIDSCPGKKTGDQQGQWPGNHFFGPAPQLACGSAEAGGALKAARSKPTTFITLSLQFVAATYCSRIMGQPPSAPTCSRIFSQPAPCRSRCRCSNSTRVFSGPSATNSSATSLARAMSGLNDQSGCKCQDSTTFFGGSQATTLPQTHSSPFAFTSYHRPPALGSIRMSLNGVPPTWCDAGHHDPIFSVNTRKARSMGTFTWRVRL